MGTRSISADECFAIDRFSVSEIRLRNRLLDEQHEIVFAALPSAGAACNEVCELVGGEQFDNVHPLEAAGRVVAEDLCIMVLRDGAWRLDAAVLCFPSIWSLQEKLGRTTADIHIPVAHYADDLGRKVDRFFDGLRPGRAVARRNLSVKPYPLLFLPVVKSDQPVDAFDTGADGSPWWLRSEWQTLQRLPRSGAILFTIKLQLAPAKVLLDRPDRARDLLMMYRSWDDDMWRFKAAANDLRLSFIPWLERATASQFGDGPFG